MKKEYTILAAAIIALVLYLVLKDSDRTHYEIPEIDRPVKEDITRIDVNGPSGTLLLKRFDEEWRSQPEGYPLDKNKIDGMLDALSGLDVISLVSESESYLQYDLGNDKRVFVEASGGAGSLLRLDVGKSASTSRHTYVKLTGDKKVYQIGGNIRRIFDVVISSLRDKNVLTIDRASISGLTITGDGESISLTKIARPVEPTAEGEAPAQIVAWIMADSTEADGSVIDGILGRVVNLQCDGFPEQDQEIDMGAPAYTIVFKGAQPDTLTIFGTAGEKMYLAASSQYGFPFMLSEWRKDQIWKSPSEVMGQVDKEK